MKTKMMVMALLAGGAMFAQPRVSIGVGIGGYAPPAYAPAYVEQDIIPPCPGPDYTWVDGYWSQYGGRNSWISGSWQRRPYSSNYRVTPRFVQPRYSGRDSYRSRDSYRGQDRNDRGRGYEHGYEQGRQGNSFGNAYRNH